MPVISSAPLTVARYAVGNWPTGPLLAAAVGLGAILMSVTPAAAQVQLPSCAEIASQVMAKQQFSPHNSPLGLPYEQWTDADFASVEARLRECGADPAYVHYQAGIKRQLAATAPPAPRLNPSAVLARSAPQAPSSPTAAEPPSVAAAPRVPPVGTSSDRQARSTTVPQAQATEPATTSAPSAPSASQAPDVQAVGAAAPPSTRPSTFKSDSDFWVYVGFALGGLVALALYLLPTAIAFRRRHAYVWIIAGVNLFAGWTLFVWVAMLVWACWPKDKALIDPLMGNVTGTGRRNAGDVLGAAQLGAERGYRDELAANGGAVPCRDRLASLERLAKLRADGLLTEEEFQAEKANLR